MKHKSILILTVILLLALFFSIVSGIYNNSNQERTEKEKCEGVLKNLQEFRDERSIQREKAIASGILTKEAVEEAERIEEEKMSDYYYACKKFEEDN